MSVRCTYSDSMTTTNHDLTDEQKSIIVGLLEAELGTITGWLYAVPCHQETMLIRATRLGVPYEVACLADERASLLADLIDGLGQ